MISLQRPLVLVHGLWNTPTLFTRLKKKLSHSESLLFSPRLPHQCGRTPIRDLAILLDTEINETFGSESSLDILGFSMGGLISRVWLQEMEGWRRVRRFYSVGSPHQGTLTAQLVPQKVAAGISEMKIGSRFLKSLTNSSRNLYEIECRSYFSIWDLMVFPGNKAVLPYGVSISVPVFTHKSLIRNSKSLNVIVKDLLAD